MRLPAFLTGDMNSDDRIALPSWNDTAPRQAILDFVVRVTSENSPDFVAPPERIATFDNDGTLWAEQPLYFQALFLIDRVCEMTEEFLG